MSFNEEKSLTEIFQTRKVSALKNVHYAAYLLNPATQGCFLSKEEHMIATEYIDATASVMNCVHDIEVMQDLANYGTRENIFSKPFLWKAAEKISATPGGRIHVLSLEKLPRK